MKIKLSISLKLLALYMWAYIPIFILSFVPARDTVLGKVFIRETQITNWEFELLFTLIFAVWGYFLWKVSRKPDSNNLFIDFTLWAMAAHIMGMIVIGIVHSSDLVHMLRDALVLGILIGLTVFSRK